MSGSGQKGGTMKNTFMVIPLVFLCCLIVGCQQRGEVLIPQINGFGFSDYLEHSGKFSQYTNHSILGVAA
jgi:hypothetical protein